MVTRTLGLAGDLRFIMRDGKRILQAKTITWSWEGDGPPSEPITKIEAWEDIPLVEHD